MPKKNAGKKQRRKNMQIIDRLEDVDTSAFLYPQDLSKKAVNKLKLSVRAKLQFFIPTLDASLDILKRNGYTINSSYLYEFSNTQRHFSKYPISLQALKELVKSIAWDTMKQAVWCAHENVEYEYWMVMLCVLNEDLYRRIRFTKVQKKAMYKPIREEATTTDALGRLKLQIEAKLLQLTVATAKFQANATKLDHMTDQTQRLCEKFMKTDKEAAPTAILAKIALIQAEWNNAERLTAQHKFVAITSKNANNFMTQMPIFEPKPMTDVGVDAGNMENLLGILHNDLDNLEEGGIDEQEEVTFTQSTRAAERKRVTNAAEARIIVNKYEDGAPISTEDIQCLLATSYNYDNATGNLVPYVKSKHDLPVIKSSRLKNGLSLFANMSGRVVNPTIVPLNKPNAGHTSSSRPVREGELSAILKALFDMPNSSILKFIVNVTLESSMTNNTIKISHSDLMTTIISAYETGLHDPLIDPDHIAEKSENAMHMKNSIKATVETNMSSSSSLVVSRVLLYMMTKGSILTIFIYRAHLFRHIELSKKLESTLNQVRACISNLTGSNSAISAREMFAGVKEVSHNLWDTFNTDDLMTEISQIKKKDIKLDDIRKFTPKEMLAPALRRLAYECPADDVKRVDVHNPNETTAQIINKMKPLFASTNLDMNQEISPTESGIFSLFNEEPDKLLREITAAWTRFIDKKPLLFEQSTNLVKVSPACIIEIFLGQFYSSWMLNDIVINQKLAPVSLLQAFEAARLTVIATLQYIRALLGIDQLDESQRKEIGEMLKVLNSVQKRTLDRTVANTILALDASKENCQNGIVLGYFPSIHRTLKLIYDSLKKDKFSKDIATIDLRKGKSKVKATPERIIEMMMSNLPSSVTEWMKKAVPANYINADIKMSVSNERDYVVSAQSDGMDDENTITVVTCFADPKTLTVKTTPGILDLISKRITSFLRF